MSLTNKPNLTKEKPAVTSRNREREEGVEELPVTMYCKGLEGRRVSCISLATASSQLKALPKLLGYRIYSKSFKVNSALS